MVLVGALTVGDSVRATLSALADERIGEADLALLATDGFFRDELAKEVEEELGGSVVGGACRADPWYRFLAGRFRSRKQRTSPRGRRTLLEPGP